MNFKDFYEKEDKVAVKDKTAVFAFGRMNPPTRGHARLAQRVVEIAAELEGDDFIFTSQTHDSDRNPLEWKEKNSFIRELIPTINLVEDETVKSPFHVIEWLKERGYTDVVCVVGSDRINEFEDRWIQYAKEEFKIARVMGTTGRDPDSKGIAGMSSTKAREAARENDLAKFRIATGWSGEISSDLMRAVGGR